MKRPDPRDRDPWRLVLIKRPTDKETRKAVVNKLLLADGLYMEGPYRMSRLQAASPEGLVELQAYCRAVGNRLRIPYPPEAHPHPGKEGYVTHHAWLAEIGEHLLLEQPEFRGAVGRPRGSFGKDPSANKRAVIQRRYRRKKAQAKKR
jgi:hypothetical protein